MRTLLPDCPYPNPPHDFARLVEIPDGRGHPLLLTSLATAQRRKLPRRIVLGCLRDPQGRFFLLRTATSRTAGPGLWGLSVNGSVMAGESFEGAVLRELDSTVGIKNINVRVAASLPYTNGDGASLFAVFFMAGPTSLPPRLQPKVAGRFVDATEIQSLMDQQQSTLTPELVWAVRSGWLFPQRTNSIAAC